MTLLGVEHATFRLVVVRVGNAFYSLLVAALWNVSLECAVLPQTFTIFTESTGKLQIMGYFKLAHKYEYFLPRHFLFITTVKGKKNRMMMMMMMMM
jgi:hypothetical protein